MPSVMLGSYDTYDIRSLFHSTTRYSVYVLYFTPHEPLISILTNKIRPLSKSLNYKIMALNPTIDILDVICSGLEVAGSVVALGDEDVVVYATL
jgi:hypothetical protein